MTGSLPWACPAVPHRLRDSVARYLKLAPDRVRLLTARVGEDGQGAIVLDRPLAGLLATVLEGEGAFRPDLLIPVPLHPSRLRERTYNQSLLLARQRVTVRMMVIDFSDPDEYLVDTMDLFYIGAAPIDAQTVQGKLEPVMDWLVPVPFYRTTASLFPGVWSA